MFRELGVRHALLYLAERVIVALRLPVRIHAWILVSQPVPARPRLDDGRGQAFTSRILDEGDPAFRELPLDPSTVAARHRQSARCLALFRDERLAACLWYSLGDYDEDVVRCRFRPLPEAATAWDFDVHVQPEFRNGLAFAALWDHVDEHFRALGKTRTLSRISAFNTRSLASHRRLGAVELGRVTFFGIGSLQVMLASQPPRLHVGLGDTARPLIELRS